MTLEASQWQQARAQFRQLCDLPEHVRERELAALRIQQPDLAELVDGLLAADANSEARVLDAVHQARDAYEHALAAADQAGPWRLLSLIGRGGMGEVWRARRRGDGFEQVAALKLLKRGMDSDAVLRRFLIERRILARLHHPCIARMLDAGVTASGRPYLAMELIEGESITAYVERCRPGLEALLQLFLKICAAVDYAHRNLVVHRDLKPSNILVDAAGLPHLLDFGIAKLLEEEGEEATATGLLPMTPAYAAPEQLAGGHVTTATDVHALGLVLYELLTGELPRERRHSPAEAVDVETRPSQRLRPAHPLATGRMSRLGADLDAIVLTALRADPQRRYPSVAALASDLERLLEGRTVSARGNSTGYRLSRLLRRHRGRVVAAATTLTALLLTLAISLWQTQRTREALASMEAEFQRAELQTRRAEATRDFLLSLFENSNPGAATGDAARSVPDLLRHAATRMETALDQEPLAQAELSVALARALHSYGDMETSGTLLARGLAALEAQPEASAASLALALQLQSMQLNLSGRVAEAEAPARRALQLLETLPASDAQAKARRAVRTTLAVVLSGTGRELEALELRRADLQERSSETDAHPATGWYNLGISYLRLERFDESVDALREARRELGDDQRVSVQHVMLAAGLASALAHAGDFVQAERELARAEDWVTSHFPDHQRHWALLDHQRALIELKQGRSQQARSAALRAYAGAELGLLDHAYVSLRLAQAQIAESEYAAAAATAGRGAALASAQRGEGHPVAQVLRAAEAFALWSLHADRSQLDALRQIAQRLEHAASRSEYAQAAAWMAIAARESEEQRYWRDQANTTLSDLLGPLHPWTLSLAGTRSAARRGASEP